MRTKMAGLYSSPSLALNFYNKNMLLLSSCLKPKYSLNAKHNPAIEDSDSVSKKEKSVASRIDRRNVLISLAGSATGLSIINQSALSSPIITPDIAHECNPADTPGSTINCCPPKFDSTIIDFKPPPNWVRLKVRPALHSVTDEYISKYEKAVELMRALPADDPRSFMQQANVHCAYCDSAYDQVGFPNLPIQVHGCWIFFPWHRLYIYFYERILGKLIGDDTFALPFWNWDNPSAMTIPKAFANPCSSLYDVLRNPNHQPPITVDLDYNGTDRSITNDQQIDLNLKIMHRAMISNAKTTELFLGKPYRTGDEPSPGAGTFEIGPHASVHSWTGDPKEPYGEDMGAFYSSGRDPIFFVHHANVDRMWSIWKRLGHKDFDDPDYLNTEFLFFDENAQLVRVKVKDCLTSESLGYAYEEVGIPWLYSKPTPITNTNRMLLDCMKATANTTFPFALNSAMYATVKRENTLNSKTVKTRKEEVLRVDIVELKRDTYIKFDVYINTTDHREVGPEASNFAGSFTNLPHKIGNVGNEMMEAGAKLRLGITDLLQDIEAENDETLLVTIVPRAGNVTIGGLDIEVY